ncbi:MAG: FAD/NAD(P)-binding oxidoreductase [Candidatus Caldarchaeum sp.]
MAESKPASRRSVLTSGIAAAAGLLVGIAAGSQAFPRTVTAEKTVVQTQAVTRTETRAETRTETVVKQPPRIPAGDFTWKVSGSTNIVVVGAGPAGAQFTKRIVELVKNVNVTIIDRNSFWVSGPSHVDFVGGIKELKDAVVYFDKLVGDRVRLVNANVVAIDPAERRVETNYGYTKYDLLVLAPGIELATWEVPGLERVKNLHAWDPGLAVRLREELRKLDGGNVVFSVPPAPYKCPPAPYEVAFLSHEYLRELGKKVNVIVLDANANPQPPPKAKIFSEHMTKLGIDYRPNFKVVEVDADKSEVVSDKGERVKFDFLSLLPPNVAPGFVRRAGLGARFMDIDPATFKSKSYDDIYGLGDAVASPYTKSAYVAQRSGRRLAELTAEKLGVTPPEKVSVFNTCWSYVNKKQLSVIEVEWDAKGAVVSGYPKVGDPTEENFGRRQAWERSLLLGIYG